MKVSVCTLARGREDRLRNLMRALDAQTRAPDEMVVVAMQPQPFDLHEVGFPVHQIHVDGERLPLARARNAAARAAAHPWLLFLDVDCLPLPDHIEAFARDGALMDGACAMGEVRYLDGHADPAASEPDDLWETSAAHPARAFGDAARELDDHGEFWSLCFALPARVFHRVGGFDEGFEGYGGEDTDFAMALAAARVPLRWVPGARAVHQWHPVSIPPLQHLEDIVRNANRFAAKHGRDCMDYWTAQLAADGFVARDPPRGKLRIVRRPSADELQAALRGPGVRFS